MKTFVLWVSKHRLISSIFTLLFLVLLGSVVIRAKHNSVDNLTHPLKKGPIIESVYGIGTVTASKSYLLKYGVHTTIKKLYVKEGDHVKAEQKLVEMLDGNTLKAPFSGTITALPYKVGENVLAQSSILNLVDLEDRYIVVSLEQRSAILVHPGQKAKLSFDGMRIESYEGVVGSVYSNENNFLVRIDAAKLPPQILPGMTADVAISIGSPHNALLIPVSALDDDKVYVKHLKGTKPINVKIGIVDGSMAEVLAGDLHEGDQLIIRMKASS